ncbi:sigma-70 family RNA polymerase sigma factor [Geodermatophilus sp. CPCC 206100]|uniref:sigma-70 family RNA polymerase sigma factor n=1 Tax=Geodermatophilus sp. CPCC 206100 TaxID=3020054 RepID=UPI003B0082FD
MDESEELVNRFGEHRQHLRAVAYRMLGSPSEADDAVQEAWLRLSRSDVRGVDDLRGWLTTVVARISLDALRSRRHRREEPLGPHLPEPVVARDDGTDPESEALLADSVGLALLVVLDELAPPERLAFVLHDVFAVPFDEIAPIVERSPAAARQLASRARRRVRGAPVPAADRAGQRRVVSAFLAASRDGDFDALLAVLDPTVVLRADREVPPGAPREVRGARAVAARALDFSGPARTARPVLVNGSAGAVLGPHGRPFAVMGFTVTEEDRIAEIDVVADPARVRRLDLPGVDGHRD